jgi:energy-coupling factor transporter ATP-binding protein EcfA2
MVQRLLILTGPTGSGKTTSLRVLAREMDFEIAEYKDTTNTTQFSVFSDEPSTCTSGKILIAPSLVLNWRSRYLRCLCDLRDACGRVHVGIRVRSSEDCVT